MSTDNCGHTVIDKDGYEQPCDLPAGEWRWYQNVEHEDMLAPACFVHANEGGRRMHAAEAKVARVEALAHRARLGTVSASDITAALAEPERDEESGR